MSLHAQVVPPLSHALKSLSKILDKAEAHCAARRIDPSVLLSARLYPDMLPLTRQVQIACDHARRGAMRLAGAEPAAVPDGETTFADLRARIALSLDALAGFKPADFDGAEARTLTFKAGHRDVTFKGGDFVPYWLVPNFYFHMTTAYAILRHNGVEIGKSDFLGG
jgi:uncharacterized protein